MWKKPVEPVDWKCRLIVRRTRQHLTQGTKTMTYLVELYFVEADQSMGINRTWKGDAYTADEAFGKAVAFFTPYAKMPFAHADVYKIDLIKEIK